MFLKRTNHKSSLFDSSKKWSQKHRIKSWILFLFVIFFTCGFAFISGVFLHRSGYLTEEVRPAILRNAVYLPKRVNAFFKKPELEKIVIDIKHKNYMKLAYDREIALSQGVLFTSADDFVNGEIRYKDKIYRVSLRLKGDEPDHFSGDKWSLRVKIKGDDSLFGMKVFSIQHPKTRNFIHEWLLHQVLKMEGLIYHRYMFVNITINGKDMGIYALEEHMDKRLIEHNQRREGPILKFSEALLWKEKLQQLDPFYEAAWNGSGSYTSSEIEAYQINTWAQDTLGSIYVRKATNLLESFRRGDITTSEAFDVKQLATYFAVMDLFGAYNGTQWPNIRFYYNPLTAKLEPIGRDGTAIPIKKILAEYRQVTSQFGQYSDILYSNFFKDNIFFKYYIQELERISQESYLEKFFSSIDKGLTQNLYIIYSEFPDFVFSKDILFRNQKYISTVLEPVKGLHAYLNRYSNNRITIDLGNIQKLPIEMVNAVYKDSVFFHLAQTTILPSKDLMQSVNYQKINFKLPKNFVWCDSMINDLYVNYKILGSGMIRQELVRPPMDFGSKFLENDYVRKKPNINSYDFLIKNPVKKEIYLKPGSWTINQTLIIPDDYNVICGEGTVLNLKNSAVILSFSSLKFIGSEELPITIFSEDSTGQGIVVLNAGKPSILEYVIFKNLSNPVYQGWELTGSVTFYESDVQISHCQFLDNRCEDGLNIIRSEFNINNSLFRGSFSDAFDGDFTRGQITKTSFINCGNDGVDVSGSVIDIEEVYINGAGDKGVSNGENSEMRIKNSEIINAEIAVASKDISNIKLNNMNISGGQIGLCAYQKKPEFGPGTISANEVYLQNVPIPCLVEERSHISIDGDNIPPSRDNVKDILYGVEFGKASK